MEGVTQHFISRTNSPARIDAIHSFATLQGDFVLNPRCSMVMSPRHIKNISSLALNVTTGAVLQVWQAAFTVKRTGRIRSGDGPYSDYLKSFLRQYAVFPGNVTASATRSISPLCIQSVKNGATGKSISGHDRVGVGHNNKTVNTDVVYLV